MTGSDDELEFVVAGPSGDILVARRARNLARMEKASSIINEAYRMAADKVKETKDYSTEGWVRFVNEALGQIGTSMFASREEIEEWFSMYLEVSASKTREHLRSLELRHDFF